MDHALRVRVRHGAQHVPHQLPRTVLRVVVLQPADQPAPRLVLVQLPDGGMIFASRPPHPQHDAVEELACRTTRTTTSQH